MNSRHRLAYASTLLIPQIRRLEEEGTAIRCDHVGEEVEIASVV
jgi:hypothetical protein